MFSSRTRKSNPTARKALAAASAAALLLSGCVSAQPGASGNYVRPVGGSPVTGNPTPYSAALVCMAEYAARYGVKPPRIAVGRISDLTGKLEDNGGRMVTQGAALMAMSALGKAGVPLVERYETDVSKLEYALANNRLVSDDRQADPEGHRSYRPIYPGTVSGSDFFLTGGITELNANIRTSNVTATAGDSRNGRSNGNLSGDVYVMNVGIDLRLVDTQTLDVVDIISYQKQIVGRQVGVGVYAFFGNNVLNVAAGTSGEEPIHLAVRSLVERAVVEMVANLYGAPGPEACIDPANDPLRDTVVTAGLTGEYVPVDGAPASNNAHTREDPRRWKSDPVQ